VTQLDKLFDQPLPRPSLAAERRGLGVKRGPMFRWSALAVFLAALSISALRRWQARRAGGTIARREEPPGLIAGRVFVAFPLIGSVIAYVARPAWMEWASLGLPSWARWTGLALGVVVVPSVNWVLTTLGANVSETVLTKPQHRLVTTGPYRWVRHPLYTVGIALFVSIGLMAANWFILLCALVALIALRLVVIPREEAQLVATFGDDYCPVSQRHGLAVAIGAAHRTPPL
jgi:protein-S-isoprenylcysteine O-methyltransferase Ste14